MVSREQVKMAQLHSLQQGPRTHRMTINPLISPTLTKSSLLPTTMQLGYSIQLLLITNVASLHVFPCKEWDGYPAAV